MSTQPAATSMIRVPTSTRDLVREGAAKHGMTQGEFVERAIRELTHREWVARGYAEAVEAMKDPAYVAQMRAWDDADLDPGLREYTA